MQQFGGLAILMLTAMVTMLTVAYYTKEGVIAPEEDGVLAGGAFHNGTSLIDLDLDPQNSHGVCMPKADQAYLVFIDGLLIAQGSDNCDMEFVDKLYRKQQEAGRMFIHENAAHVKSWALPVIRSMMREL